MLTFWPFMLLCSTRPVPGKSAFCLPRVTPGCNLPRGKIHWLRSCDDYIALASHIHDNANSVYIPPVYYQMILIEYSGSMVYNKTQVVLLAFSL